MISSSRDREPAAVAGASGGASPARVPLAELAAVFLRLGFTGFGGPAVHIAMMEAEIVRRRGWLAPAEFVDLIGATNLIPGPNSTEMALHIGLRRGGAAGFLLAGACFIGPAVLITLGLASAYVQLGQRPEALPFLHGIRPALLAVVLGAVYRLGRVAFSSPVLLALGAVVAGLSLFGWNELLLLLGAGVGALLLRGVSPRGGAATAREVGLVPLGLFFLKVGSVLYGSGYVLIAFLEGELVQRRGWLTRAELLDAIAMGQLTPGPLSSTATFIGYRLGGWGGAAVATLGMFLPAFVFVLLLSALLPRLKRGPATVAFLAAVNAASIALMAAVTLRWGRDALADPAALAIAVVAGVATIRFNVGAHWLVLGGAAAGWLARTLFGG